MTDPTDTDGMDENEALAGELALRVLSPGEEAAARAREAADPAFAVEVETWNERLAGMADEIAPVTPSPYVWPRVEAGLPPVAANDNRRLAFWRTWAMGSTGLLAASLVAVVVLLAQPLGYLGFWIPVILIGIGASAHQAWSANLFTTVSDMFPKHSVGSVVGIGGMAGGQHRCVHRSGRGA